MSMPSEALSVRFLDICGASSGIDGGIGCNFIFISHIRYQFQQGDVRNSSTIWRELRSEHFIRRN